MSFFLKIIPIVSIWAIFSLVVLNVPYPESLTQASLNQIGLFFLPLYFALVFTLNIFLKNIFISSSISLGLILVLILKALESLNLVTGALIIISVGLLISYFIKIKRKNLTKLPKIPKLTNLQTKKDLGN